MLNITIFFYLIYLIVISPNLGFYTLAQAICLLLLIPFFFKFFLEKNKQVSLPGLKARGLFNIRGETPYRKPQEASVRFLRQKVAGLSGTGAKISKNILVGFALITLTLSYTNWFYYLRFTFWNSLLFSLIFLFSLIIILLLIFKNLKKELNFLLMFSVLLLGLFYRFTLIKHNVNPQLDGYQAVKYAPLHLLQGRNPYSSSNNYPPIRLSTGETFNIPAYSYGVTPLLLLLPHNYLFGDPRYFLATFELLTLVLIYKIISKQKAAQQNLKFILPIFYYWHPFSLYVITQGFLEPLMLFLLLLALYFHYIHRINLSLLSFALLINVKQTLFVLLFFLFKKLKISQIVKLLGFVLIFILPFFIWSPKDFLKFGLIYQYINKDLAPIRLSTLTFNSLFYHFTGNHFPQVLFLLIWLLTLLSILKYQNQKYSGLCFALSLFYTILSFFNYFSYTNYFYFCSLLIYLGITWELQESAYPNQSLKT